MNFDYEIKFSSGLIKIVKAGCFKSLLKLIVISNDIVSIKLLGYSGLDGE